MFTLSDGEQHPIVQHGMEKISYSIMHAIAICLGTHKAINGLGHGIHVHAYTMGDRVKKTINRTTFIITITYDQKRKII